MRVLPVVFGLLVLVVSPTAAHEEGVIRLGAKEVGVGAEMEIRGEKMGKNAAVKLELRGALETFPLGQVRADSAGKFVTSLALPAEARAGTYTVVAVATDGDVLARADLVVLATPPAGAPAEGHAAMGHTSEEMAAPHATDEMMDLPATTTPGEGIAVLLLTGASLGAGLWLIRGAALA